MEAFADMKNIIKELLLRRFLEMLSAYKIILTYK
jgi:hypothetical protein